MIELIAINKRLSGKSILTNVSFTIQRGEIVGITGPIGAGKSTLLHIISGLLLPDSGKIIMFNQDFQKQRSTIAKRINYASSSQRLSGYATVGENLDTYADLYNVKNHISLVLSLWSKFNFPLSHLKKKVYRLSSGENAFINFTKSLLNNPDILLLDEITSHFDPNFAKKIRAYIKARNTKEKITILVSQNPQELKILNTKTLKLKQGKII